MLEASGWIQKMSRALLHTSSLKPIKGLESRHAALAPNCFQFSNTEFRDSVKGVAPGRQRWEPYLPVSHATPGDRVTGPLDSGFRLTFPLCFLGGAFWFCLAFVFIFN